MEMKLYHRLGFRRFDLAVTVLSVMLSACVAVQVQPVPTKVHFDNAGISLSADLYLPNSARPHPVVIDLHGCNGIWEQRNNHWIPFLLKRGFAVFQVDSFTPRGVENVCNDVFRVAPMVRVMDTARALQFILRDARFDSERIFLTGMSHGGTTVLLANLYPDPVFSRLKGAIAYYPYCLEILPVLNSDLLILIGERDDWTPAGLCRNMEIGDAQGHDYELVVYPETYHTFDVPGTDTQYLGHRILYNPDAAADSLAKVELFLTRTLP